MLKWICIIYHRTHTHREHRLYIVYNNHVYCEHWANLCADLLSVRHVIFNSMDMISSFGWLSCAYNMTFRIAKRWKISQLKLNRKFQVIIKFYELILYLMSQFAKDIQVIRMWFHIWIFIFNTLFDCVLKF